MSLVVWKEIRPSKFKKEAFLDAFAKASHQAAKDIEIEYKRTTKSWKRKPKWSKIIQIGPRSVEIFVGTDNEIYGYVDKGTKAHIIRPKKKKILRFRGQTYKRGRPKESDYVFTPIVHHPGFKGYQHTKRILKKWKPLFKKRIERAMQEGAKNSGHSRRS